MFDCIFLLLLLFYNCNFLRNLFLFCEVLFLLVDLNRIFCMIRVVVGLLVLFIVVVIVYGEFPLLHFLVRC